MEIVLFGCSTSCIAYDGIQPKGKTYVDRLQEKYASDLRGIWKPGLNVITTKQKIADYTRGYKNWVIFHLGAVEAATHPSKYILEYCVKEIIPEGFVDFPFSVTLQQAIDYPDHFHHIIDPMIFQSYFQAILDSLWNSKVIVIGLGQPFTHLVYQGDNFYQYNQILTGLNGNHHFIDVWNDYPVYMQDSNHLNEAGHERLFCAIEDIIKGES